MSVRIEKLPLFLLLVLSCITISTGCNDNGEKSWTNQGACPASAPNGVDDSNEDRADIDFEKPPSADEEYEFDMDHLLEFDPPSTGSRMFFSPSPAMSPDSTGSNAYLYENEKAVFRFGARFVGDITEGDFRIITLVNFEPVPFGMIETDSDDRFASDEETLELDERSLVHHYHRREGEPFGMSMVVDPEYFEYGKANELRLVLIQDVDQITDLQSDRARPITNVVGTLVHYAGSTPFEFDCATDAVAHTPESELHRQFHMSMRSYTELLHDGVEPAQEQPGPNPFPDLRRVEEIDSSDATIRSSIAHRSGGADRFAVLYDYINGEFIHLGLIQDIPSYHPWYSQDFSEDLAIKVETSIVLAPGEEAAYLTMSFDGWYDHSQPVDLAASWEIEVSNLVWFRFVE